MDKKTISIVTTCYNEEKNVEKLYIEIKRIMEKEFPYYNYELIFIDNASEDETVNILKQIAKKDKNIKIIVNSRNFGQIRSHFYVLRQTEGNAVIYLATDFQDPPNMISQFIKKWEQGNEIVLAIKKSSKENFIMFKFRKLYYTILKKISEVDIYKNYTGFGLYDKKIINIIKKIDDPYPFFRGLIAEIGFSVTTIEFEQPVRKRGKTKNNFYTLYDVGILGIMNNSKVPLRLAIFLGTFFSALSFMIGIVYFIMKLIYWNQMSLGLAPLVILSSFMFSVLLVFLGIIGEYIGAIYTQVLKRPLVFEKERINFEETK